MSYRVSYLFVLLAVIFLQSGCMLVKPIQQMTHETLRVIKPRPNDYRDPTDEVDDQWSGVGIEGRGDKASDFRVDSLFSKKAQSIERNTGGRR